MTDDNVYGPGTQFENETPNPDGTVTLWLPDTDLNYRSVRGTPDELHQLRRILWAQHGMRVGRGDDANHDHGVVRPDAWPGHAGTWESASAALSAMRVGR